jgi:hypothetical protein
VLQYSLIFVKAGKATWPCIQATLKTFPQMHGSDYVRLVTHGLATDRPRVSPPGTFAPTNEKVSLPGTFALSGGQDGSLRFVRQMNKAWRTMDIEPEVTTGKCFVTHNGSPVRTKLEPYDREPEGLGKAYRSIGSPDTIVYFAPLASVGPPSMHIPSHVAARIDPALAPCAVDPRLLERILDNIDSVRLQEMPSNKATQTESSRRQPATPAFEQPQLEGNPSRRQYATPAFEKPQENPLLRGYANRAFEKPEGNTSQWGYANRGLKLPEGNPSPRRYANRALELPEGNLSLPQYSTRDFELSGGNLSLPQYSTRDFELSGGNLSLPEYSTRDFELSEGNPSRAPSVDPPEGLSTKLELRPPGRR